MIAQIALFLGEVGDKEFTIPTLRIVAVVLCASGFVLSSWAPLGGGNSPVTIFVGVVPSHRLGARDPYVSRAIRDELGISYVVQSYLSALLPLAFIAWPLFRRTARAA
jgi:hypothetical protein